MALVNTRLRPFNTGAYPGGRFPTVSDAVGEGERSGSRWVGVRCDTGLAEIIDPAGSSGRIGC